MPFKGAVFMPKRVIRRSKYLWFSLRLWRRRIAFWGGGVSIGIVAILFALGSEQGNLLFNRLLAISPLLPLLVTPLGMALVLAISRRYFPGSQGSGIPQTIAAIKVLDSGGRHSLLSLRIAAGKIFLTLLALTSGASVGREGPTVQIGASIMYTLSRFTRFSRPEMEKGLILAGGAAGVAAAFNTPLAGIVFAIEEMSRSFEERTSGTVLTTVIVSGLISLAWLGNYTYFGHTSAALDLGRGWIAVAVCGVAGGVMGGLFSRVLLAAASGLPGRVGRWMRDKPVRFAALCGFALALLGLLSGNATYGTGYPEARQLLEGGGSLSQSYGILKMLATIVSYISGIPGGIFAPSLAVGAGFGANLSVLVPFAPAGAVVILGMVAYFAGVVQAPITAFVIVMEMTDNSQLILPLMATAFIAHATSQLVCPKPLYKTLADGFMRRLEAPASAAEKKIL